MPTYEYRCSACGHQLEEFQYINDPPLKKCPECKKNKLVRLISGGAAIVFKGSGFYETDYRSESYKKGAKAADSAKTETGSSSSASKSDTSGKESAKPDKPTKPAKP